MKKFERICGMIIGSMPLLAQWQWDERLNLAYVSLDESAREPVLAALSEAFDQEWDYLNIENAPESVSRLLSAQLSLVPSQKAFIAENESGQVLFALWWPWGDGQKASLRIGLSSPEEDGPDKRPDKRPDENSGKSEIKERLAMWFAI